MVVLCGIRHRLRTERDIYVASLHELKSAVPINATPRAPRRPSPSSKAVTRN